MKRKREVAGFEFDDLPIVSPLPFPALPDVLPFVKKRSRRVVPLREAAIGISLYDLVGFRAGSLKLPRQRSLSDHFCVRPGATFVASGVKEDDRVENWWRMARRPDVIRQLRDVGIAMVTVPNFSLFTNVPREDNMHGMKRIASIWTEFMMTGMPAALHVNGRTERDYERWAAWIRDQGAVRMIAFEFATGAGSPLRIDWHVSQLALLAERVNRPLSLIVRGGTHRLEALRQHFAQVVLFDTDAYFKATKRRRGFLTHTGRLRWVRSPTKKGSPIDVLLAENIRVVRSRYDSDQHEAPRKTA